MPIYEFKCRECGKVSEVLLRTVDSQKVRCPNCGSGSMERLISSSHMMKMGSSASGTTCCGRAERCDTPPCSTEDGCRRR